MNVLKTALNKISPVSIGNALERDRLFALFGGEWPATSYWISGPGGSGNPPVDIAEKVVNVEQWMKGHKVIIKDVAAFIERHLAFMSQPEILSALQKALKQSSAVILSEEKAILARLAVNIGLFKIAESLYNGSIAGFAKEGLKQKQATALQELRLLHGVNFSRVEMVDVQKKLEN